MNLVKLTKIIFSITDILATMLMFSFVFLAVGFPQVASIAKESQYSESSVVVIVMVGLFLLGAFGCFLVARRIMAGLFLLLLTSLIYGFYWLWLAQSFGGFWFLSSILVLSIPWIMSAMTLKPHDSNSDEINNPT